MLRKLLNYVSGAAFCFAVLVLATPIFGACNQSILDIFPSPQVISVDPSGASPISAASVTVVNGCQLTPLYALDVPLNGTPPQPSDPLGILQHDPATWITIDQQPTPGFDEESGLCKDVVTGSTCYVFKFSMAKVPSTDENIVIDGVHYNREGYLFMGWGPTGLGPGMGEGIFLLAQHGVPSASSCLSLIIGAVIPTADGPNINALFFPNSQVSLPAAASICDVDSFNWQQTVEDAPLPINPTDSAGNPLAVDVCLLVNDLCAFTNSNPSTHLVPPFPDPPESGYTYDPAGTAGRFPFYYSNAAVPSGCAEAVQGNCETHITVGNTLHFFDAPKLPVLNPKRQTECKQFLAGPVRPCFTASTTRASFTTSLVGVKGNTLSRVFSYFTWTSNFDEDSGRVTLSTNVPADPSSGTGGVTITGINGVLQSPPSVTCAATPTSLWPANGKSVPVTVSGVITPGTSALAAGSSTYTVVDEYGQIRPTGNITMGTGGTYSFSVPLIASRNGDDKDGRTYTITVASQKDTIGNIGSCSAVVNVPHDQR